MGSSYVDFRGKGFEANDAQVEVWLHLLVEEIDKLDQPPKWLLEVHTDWHIQSTEGFGYGVMPNLDRYATDEERCSMILQLCERTLTRLEQYGEHITEKELNAMQTGGKGHVFMRDLSTGYFKKTGQYFMKLLQGTLREEENSVQPFHPPMPKEEKEKLLRDFLLRSKS